MSAARASLDAPTGCRTCPANHIPLVTAQSSDIGMGGIDRNNQIYFVNDQLFSHDLRGVVLNKGHMSSYTLKSLPSAHVS